MAGLLHLLLPLLLAVSASAQELLSIDCGASENYTNANGIGWVVDGPFVQRGEAHSVENTSGVPREFATLRAFTSRKKNCYTIPVNPGGWKMQILLRASFYYGNYDGKATPPAFDLLFEGNRWGTVETTAGDVVFTEAIYSVGEATSVCVAQTKPGQFPFISTIEVRNLEDDMYPNFDPNRWLLMRDRLAFGAARTIRYPDDRYDRIWMPARVNGLAVLKNESVVDVSPEAAKGRPPAAVFQAAVGTNSRSSPIALSTSLPSESTEVNINLYFAEMKQLRLTDVRAVDVTMDGVSLQAGSSAISAQEVLEFSISYRSANASTSIVVQAASDSTLPPIISAMEVFSVGDERQATDSGEVEILGMMQQRWPVLTDWTGDPCLPTPYNWEWVACSSDASPHISALLLSGLGLSGEFPEFSPVALSTVEKVDLHNNSLSGPIPHAFGLMPNLKELNLANNNFNGTLPSSLYLNSNIKLDVSGNPNLCISDDSCSSSSGTGTTAASPGKKKSSKTGLIVGITVPLVLVFFIVVGVMVYLHSRRTSAPIRAIEGKPSAYDAPSGTHSHPPLPMPAVDSREIPPPTDGYRIEIQQQMGSELADLIAQQAQQQSMEHTEAPTRHRTHHS